MSILTITLFLVCLTFTAFSHARVVRPAYLAEKYQIQITYDGNSNPEYVGKSLEPCTDSEACWQVFKITYSGTNPINIQYCNGTHEFTAVWNNRASCVYA